MDTALASMAKVKYIKNSFIAHNANYLFILDEGTSFFSAMNAYGMKLKIFYIVDMFLES